ncbi:MAG: hypothetical protein ACI35R_10830 [Bacillus sp. (in: firmicutes)]
MTYTFLEKHFRYIDGSLVFEPIFDANDYEIQQLVLEAERNIGALVRLGLKNNPLKANILKDATIRAVHFTTKMEKNQLTLKEVTQLF